MKKTAKEWWDESGFGTFLYWDDDGELIPTVLVGLDEGFVRVSVERFYHIQHLKYDVTLFDKPPKKKVKKYQWVYKGYDGRCFITYYYYKDKSFAQDSLTSKDTVILRIEESMIEVEEDQ